ncbi:unnamed protein product [Peronospora belbahrii]|uniref:FAM86 N-terminal domain-containing protein n=1 Tax=Peronospora belbahrii TaxID=622444 RepID=A0ABN8D011_9STRA|nr:unnamed protein product [Peronospora belbahrii]
MTSISSPLTLRMEFQQQFRLFESFPDPLLLRLGSYPASLMELQDVIQDHLREYLTARNDVEPQFMTTKFDMRVEVYDQKQQQFVLLEDLSQLGRRARLSLSLTNLDKVFQGSTCLALPSKVFGYDLTASDKFMIHGRMVYIEEVGNSGQGTGLTTWDGSVILAKYLEHQRHHEIAGTRVVELGAGTGLVGISAALLGAQEVLLTDLDYVVENLAKNVAETMKLAANAGQHLNCHLSTRVLDWFNPPTDLGDIDFVLASDVVWVEELIQPLVATFDTLVRHSATKTQILMSYQKRSIVSDRLLCSELKRYHFVKTRVPTRDLHPKFSTERIDVWEIKRETTSSNATRR